MKKVRVDLGKRSYDILIAPGLLEQAPGLLDGQGIGRRLFLVVNTTVFQLYGQALVERLTESGFRVTEILIPDGEKFKNLHTVENIYTYLIAQRADRESALAALGGGVTGDVAGFVAATFLRGISYVQFPTTLLAQVDSSVGGKTGVNHPHGKNMIGVFYQPSLVCVDTLTLATLSEREYRSGLYEVIKYGLIYDAEFFGSLGENLEAIGRREPEVLEPVIGRCCRIKAEVTSIDEREAGLRRILNFGHTFGHALEVAAGFQGITHGEAVAYGMLAAGRLSHRLGLISSGELDRLHSTILEVGPLPPVDHLTAQQLLEAMERDKKRRDDRKVFVLLDGIGRTAIRSDIGDEVLSEVWKEVFPLARV